MIRRAPACVLMAAAVLASAGPALAQAGRRLSLQEAEREALVNHPQIRAGQYNVLAAGELVRETRSAYFPTVFGAVTGVEAEHGTDLAAGGLNSSGVLDRFSLGVAASELLTDFGRTARLSATASLRVTEQERDLDARRASVLLTVDLAYFDALGAQAVLRVADQTVEARQVVVDQVSALAASGLKSALDLSFAKVSLSEAQLLRVQARNNVDAAFATLATALGTSRPGPYDLADEPLSPAPPTDGSALVAQALRDRPDVARERFAQQSAAKFATAERALWFPTVAAIGAAGVNPFHQTGLTNQYGAIGLNVIIPITNGNLFSARSTEANYRASEEQQVLQDLENNVSRDVYVAWLNARTAYERLTLTAQLLAEASDALDLAQQRYHLGLSSIVELTQAQLNLTNAQIEQATAQDQYQRRTAVLRFQVGSLK